jgi:tetratricopeptide (TPR) repeat protein
MNTICANGNEYGFCEGRPLAMEHLNLGVASESAYWLIFRDCKCTLRENTIQIVEKQNSNKTKILFTGSAAYVNVISTMHNGLRDIVVFLCPDVSSNSVTCFDTLRYNGDEYWFGNQKTPANSTLLEMDKNAFDSLTAFEDTKAQMDSAWKKSIVLSRSGKYKEASNLLLSAIGSKPWTIENHTLASFNDLGYFLEQSGEYSKAIEVLDAVVKAFPDRTVAYLNLADAYAGLGDSVKAKANYSKYADMMKTAGKQSKIPKRVLQYIGR